MTYASEVLADSPLGFWPITGPDAPTSRDDSSGNGFDGSWVGTPAYESRDFGVAGLADVADFNGSYLTITDATGLGDQVNDASIEAWVIFDSLSGSRLIFTQDNTSSSSRPNFYFWWKGSTNEIVVGWRSGSTYYDHLFSWSPSTATTYHLVATADGTNVRFYANGSLVGTVAQSSAPTAGVGTQYVIGADYGGTSAFSGAIGYVAFYGSALSSTRVTDHYDAGTAAATPKSDTDSFTFTDGTPTVTASTSKSDTDTFTATDAGTVQAQIQKVATDLFIASELEFLNYTPTAPLAIKFTAHRTFAAIGETAPPLTTRSRFFDLSDTEETLYARIFDPSGNVIDLTSLTVTFDVGTPGARVEGTSGDITVSVSGTLATITIPGGLAQGVYSCRLTVNTGTEESPVYRSYPTEAITLVVT